MNMQYARAVTAHEQTYRDRPRANHLTANINVRPKTEVGHVAALPSVCWPIPPSGVPKRSGILRNSTCTEMGVTDKRHGDARCR